MAQKTFSLLRSLSLVAFATFMLAHAPLAHAEEAEATAEAAAPIEAVPAEKPAHSATPAKPASTVEAAPAEAVAAPAEKPLTDAQKQEAIAGADAITTFDASKVVGMAKPWQIYYQPAESPSMKELETLHDPVLVLIIAITVFVLALLLYIIVRFNKRANPKPASFTHNKTIEVIWTVIPILILVGIAIPSIRVHYKFYNNETIINNPDLTLKVVGHQWYWEYEYPDQGIKYDSNMTPEKDLPAGAPRLLEVDNAVVVPVNKVVRVQITSADVIHAWVLPSFGVKKAAVPGRLNETWFKAEKEGIYYGQCSVLCGKLHGFMPVKIIVVSEEEFDQWVKGAKLKFATNNAMQFAALN